MNTCVNCRHWHERPTDPHNLGAPRDGQCREQLHVVGVPVPGGTNVMAVYPVLPGDFPACGRFEPALALDRCLET